MTPELAAPGVLDLETYPHGLDQTDRLVANDLESAGFESVPRADIMAWKYRKLLMNLGLRERRLLDVAKPCPWYRRCRG